MKVLLTVLATTVIVSGFWLGYLTLQKTTTATNSGEMTSTAQVVTENTISQNEKEQKILQLRSVLYGDFADAPMNEDVFKNNPQPSGYYVDKGNVRIWSDRFFPNYGISEPCLVGCEKFDFSRGLVTYEFASYPYTSDDSTLASSERIIDVKTYQLTDLEYIKNYLDNKFGLTMRLRPYYLALLSCDMDSCTNNLISGTAYYTSTSTGLASISFYAAYDEKHNWTILAGSRTDIKCSDLSQLGFAVTSDECKK